MAFKKFGEIENSYREKELNYFLDLNPELKNETYIVWEKIDGSNIQLYMEPTYDMFKVASRNQPIERTTGFFGVWDVLNQERFTEFTKILEDYAKEYECTLNLYGELYGNSIQGRIGYGTTNIKFYDIRINDIYLTPEAFIKLMESFGFSDLICPYVLVEGLDNCLEYDVETPISELCPPDAKNKYIEGVVFSPYLNNFYSPLGSKFTFKKKSKLFSEGKVAKLKKLPSELSEATIELNETFRTYINENRVLSSFSKEGKRIENMSDIGHWIRIILDDAKADFMKDYSEEMKNIPDSEKKKVFSLNSELVNILKSFL